jgi:multidrug resistance efflux pump
VLPAVVSASGKLLPVRWANLAFQSGGRVVEVKVQSGDKVEAGQIVVRLDDADARLALAQANAALKSAQAQLAQIKAGPRPAEIASAEQGIKQAAAAADGAAAQLAQLQAGPTKPELDVARANLASAQAQRDRAQAQLDLLKAGATAEQIAVAEANVAQAQVGVDQAKAALDKTQLQAPFAGTVGSVMVREGEMLVPGQPVLTVGDLTGLHVETTDLSEVDVARVLVGAPVNVTFDAVKGKTFTGKVARIAPMSSQGQGGVNYTVIVELDQLDPALRWGMTAFTDIQVK